MVHPLHQKRKVSFTVIRPVASGQGHARAGIYFLVERKPPLTKSSGSVIFKYSRFLVAHKPGHKAARNDVRVMN